MRYCSNCGSALPEGATVCPNCGTPVPAEAGHTPSGYASAPPPTGYASAPPPPGYNPPGYGYPPPQTAAGGLSVNAASALCYVLGLITGIIFLVLEPYKRSSLVRFHAFQSIFLNLAWIVIWIGWGIVSAALVMMTHGIFLVISMLVNLVLGLGALILWIILLIRAAQGQKWVLPVVGPLAEKQAGSGPF